jgi:hypothetical protein
MPACSARAVIGFPVLPITQRRMKTPMIATARVIKYRSFLFIERHKLGG